MTYWGKNDITVIKGQELFGTIPTIDDSSHFLVTTAMLKRKKKKKKQMNKQTNKLINHLLSATLPIKKVKI